LFLISWSNTEWVEFTWVSWTTLTWLTRWLSQTSDPSVAWTGLSWIAWTEIRLVAMHDQIFNRQSPEAKTYATEAARDADLWGDWVATLSYVNIWVTATWLYYNYNLGTAQWEDIDTWTVTPNASATVAWKVEVATTAESIAWDDTWTTGAKTIVAPSDIAANEQSSTFKYAEDAEATDTYVIAMTPSLTAYTKWQWIRFEAKTVNTWVATLNVDGLWAKSIKTTAWDDPSDWDIAAGEIVDLIYDGTNFVLQKTPKAWVAREWVVELATDAEVDTWTDETRYINAKQLNDIALKEITLTAWECVTSANFSSAWVDYPAGSNISADFFFKIKWSYSSITSIVLNTIAVGTNTGTFILTSSIKRRRNLGSSLTDTDSNRSFAYAWTADTRLDVALNAAAYDTITLADWDVLYIGLARQWASDTYTWTISLNSFTITLAA